LSRKTALKPNHRAPWTAEAIGELERLAGHGLTVPEIARRLHRTEGAIRRKAVQEGVTLRRTSPSRKRQSMKPDPRVGEGDSS
jgi:hypothetical protein